MAVPLSPTVAVLLLISPAARHATMRPDPQPSLGPAPTTEEMDAFVRREWNFFGNRIRLQKALRVQPGSVGVSDTRCAAQRRAYFRCTSTIAYTVPGGVGRAVVSHDVKRDRAGEWVNSVVVREPSPSRS